MSDAGTFRCPLKVAVDAVTLSRDRVTVLPCPFSESSSPGSSPLQPDKNNAAHNTHSNPVEQVIDLFINRFDFYVVKEKLAKNTLCNAKGASHLDKQM